MTKATQNIEPTISLYGLAVEAYREHNGDVGAATNAVVEMLAKDSALLNAVVSSAIRQAVGSMVNKVATKRRNGIFAAALTPPGANRANIISLASGLAASLMDFPLANGKPLREATREDLKASIERYSAQASKLQQNTEWLTLILQAVPDGQTVGAALTEARLKDLLTAVSKENS